MRRSAPSVHPSSEGTIPAVAWDVLSEEQREIRELVRTLARERVAPRAAEIDESHEFPWDVVELFREHELFGLLFDEEHGGSGTGTLLALVAIEEVSKVCATSGLLLAVQELGSLGLKLAGSQAQKEAYLPRLASGEWLPAYALTEAGSGSDSAAMRTTAVRDGDEWVINGTKNWITNAGVADFNVVFAVTDREQGRITAFVVESNREGFSVPKYEHKLGIHGSPTGQPVLEDVRVPAENVVGEVGRGLSVALGTLERTRLGAAAQAVGLAQGATDYAVQYAKERESFGKPIIQHQGLVWKLADMQTKTAAARELLYKACALADRNDPKLSMYSSMAKLFASDVAMEVTTDAVQVLGGYGYVNEYPVERMMRDAKITQIYEGTNEIQRVVIGRHLAG